MTIPLPSNEYLANSYTTKEELARRLYPTITFDCALPQDWVNEMSSKGFDPRPCVVWGYPPHSIFGLPLPLTAEAEKSLNETTRTENV